MKYYIVETHYIGPESHVREYSELDRFEITTTPPKNATGEISWDGYLGTSNNVARYAHGVYDSLAAAEDAAVISLGCGVCLREPEEALPRGVLAIYLVPRYLVPRYVAKDGRKL